MWGRGAGRAGDTSGEGEGVNMIVVLTPWCVLCVQGATVTTAGHDGVHGPHHGLGPF